MPLMPSDFKTLFHKACDLLSPLQEVLVTLECECLAWQLWRLLRLG
jgi:hypothetical protein